MGFESILIFFADHALTAYSVLFAAMVVEGETGLIVAGVLTHLGALDFFDVCGIAYAGVMLGDFMWYGLGVALQNDRGPAFLKRMVGVAQRLVDRTFPRFMERPGVTLLLAKFIYGTNHATLIWAGLRRLPFLLFVRIQLLVSLVWVATFALVGYFFGYAAIQVTHRVSLFLLLILILIVAFIALQRFLSFFYEHEKDL
ncbi:hypothetical protein KW797_00605 [Candidatus Parcubacteria bacterium]|nr:hypothetical protein [Candidatus Parcubacteria bacterium]